MNFPAAPLSQAQAKAKNRRPKSFFVELSSIFGPCFPMEINKITPVRVAKRAFELVLHTANMGS